MGVKTFFPPEGASVNGAKSVCRRCAVSDECLKYALANPSLKGIWAGTSERRRRALRKQGPAATISISKAPIACSG
jgi:WhiB family redox-sensing transcriptional regulator